MSGHEALRTHSNAPSSKSAVIETEPHTVATTCLKIAARKTPRGGIGFKGFAPRGIWHEAGQYLTLNSASVRMISIGCLFRLRPFDWLQTTTLPGRALIFVREKIIHDAGFVAKRETFVLLVYFLFKSWVWFLNSQLSFCGFKIRDRMHCSSTRVFLSLPPVARWQAPQSFRGHSSKNLELNIYCLEPSRCSVFCLTFEKVILALFSTVSGNILAQNAGWVRASTPFFCMILGAWWTSLISLLAIWSVVLACHTRVLHSVGR